ncbi:MAG: universal stress protein [Rhodobacterales bacterium]
MIKKILVAVDGSEHSKKAVDYAASIAAAMNARLSVLYVFKTLELPKGMENYARIEHIKGGDDAILMQVSNDIVDEAKERAAKKGVTDIEAEVVHGPVARTIVSQAKRRNADMIVIGSRGLGNIEATLRGGVSMRVGMLSECPVLVVR